MNVIFGFQYYKDIIQFEIKLKNESEFVTHLMYHVKSDADLNDFLYLLLIACL